MGLKGIASHTLSIIEQRGYEGPSGARVEIGPLVDHSVSRTRLYRPADLEALVLPAARASDELPSIEVTEETTAEAARRLFRGGARVAALNFASAKNPGGGFLGGAKAQEEDLARCSALYPCLVSQRDYYDENRANESMLYTDHLIYSPEVPFFRGDGLDLLDEPFLCSIITSPAPNAGEALRRDPDARSAIRETLARRGRHILRVAAEQGHETLVLGAWGCGVFRNDPDEVAGIFAELLTDPELRGRFARIVFAIYDRSAERRTLLAFQRRYSTAASTSSSA